METGTKPFLPWLLSVTYPGARSPCALFFQSPGRGCALEEGENSLECRKFAELYGRKKALPNLMSSFLLNESTMRVKQELEASLTELDKIALHEEAYVTGILFKN
ncbi:MAG: hypothetical protein RDV48_25600 [Candidatus Eremiobacteraeota bacterium]|nr:hypothetical protein [Candidatus Eremiobacteraeota bacterium]